jgi:hypothetical protein
MARDETVRRILYLIIATSTLRINIFWDNILNTKNHINKNKGVSSRDVLHLHAIHKDKLN